MQTEELHVVTRCRKTGEKTFDGKMLVSSLLDYIPQLIRVAGYFGFRIDATSSRVKLYGDTHVTTYTKWPF